MSSYCILGLISFNSRRINLAFCFITPRLSKLNMQQQSPNDSVVIKREGCGTLWLGFTVRCCKSNMTKAQTAFRRREKQMVLAAGTGPEFDSGVKTIKSSYSTHPQQTAVGVCHIFAYFSNSSSFMSLTGKPRGINLANYGPHVYLDYFEAFNSHKATFFTAMF